MTTAMIEKVARVIWDIRENCPRTECGFVDCDCVKQAARAAIQALREPSEEMVAAFKFPPSVVREILQRIVDSILSEQVT